MQGVGAALRRTVSGCALNPQPSAGSVRWHTALASALLICASVPAMAADSAASASRSANGMIYVDSELAPASGGSSSRRASRASEPNPIYRQLSEALADYQQNWAGLPQVEIAEGAPLRPGSSGERVSLLRERLGLPSADSFDAALAAADRVVAPIDVEVGTPQGRIHVEALQVALEHVQEEVAAHVGPPLGVASGFNSMDGD